MCLFVSAIFGVKSQRLQGTAYETYYHYYFIIYGGNYTWVMGGSSGRLLTSETAFLSKSTRNSGVSATLYGGTFKE